MSGCRGIRRTSDPTAHRRTEEEPPHVTIKPDLTAQIPAELGAVHFVGIGGSGMSGIARLFLGAGHRVTGSDVRDSANIAALRDLGAEIAIGHDAANVGDADAVVVTGALWQDNPEYQLALERGLPVLHRSQALAWLIAGQRLVSVAGAHGKTTSTGMIITGLLELGEDPSFVNGGVIEELGVSAASGEGELFVVEADESDGSFLLYDTSVALITNVDPDHLDHYGSRDAFEQAFVDFADRARELVVISSDDAGATRVAARLSHERVVSFGEAADATVRVHSIETDGPVSFAIDHEGVTLPGDAPHPRSPQRHQRRRRVRRARRTRVRPRGIPRRHRALRRHRPPLRAARHGRRRERVRRLRAPPDRGRRGARGGAHRRRRGADHRGAPAAHVQPHADVRARSSPRCSSSTPTRRSCSTCTARARTRCPASPGALVSERFEDPARVAFVPDWQEAADHTARIARDGDFVITLGCGDVYRIVPQLLGSLERERG